MSYDIERETIYSETVEQIEDICGTQRTKIVAGDDGYISIIQTEDPIYGDRVEGPEPVLKVPGCQAHVGLTPSMIKAIVDWGRTRRQAVETKTHSEIVSDIFEGMEQAIEVAKGNMPVGVRFTFSVGTMILIEGLKCPPGRYEIKKIA